MLLASEPRPSTSMRAEIIVRGDFDFAFELSEIAPAQLFHATTHACSWKALGSEARML